VAIARERIIKTKELGALSRVMGAFERKRRWRKKGKERERERERNRLIGRQCGV